MHADERELTLRYATRCQICGAVLSGGTRAVWDRASKAARCVGCTMPAQRAMPIAEPLDVEPAFDFGTAGASAQRVYEAKESRRRAGLRRNWWRIAIVSVAGALLGSWLAVQTDNNVALLMIVGGGLPV